MKLTDTHAHLDKFANDGTLADVLARARAAGVERIITCATTPHEWKLYREIASENAGVFWQAGIHPTEIADGDDTALDALPALFLNDPFAPVAIGEIGLEPTSAKKSACTPAIPSPTASPKSSAQSSIFRTLSSTVLRERRNSCAN